MCFEIILRVRGSESNVTWTSTSRPLPRATWCSRSLPRRSQCRWTMQRSGWVHALGTRTGAPGSCSWTGWTADGSVHTEERIVFTSLAAAMPPTPPSEDEPDWLRYPSPEKEPAAEPSVPEPSAPEPSAPEAPAPEPSAPEALAPEPSAPEAPTPEPSAPEAPTPEPSAPEAPAPEPPEPEPPEAPAPELPEPSAPKPPEPEPPRARAAGGTRARAAGAIRARAAGDTRARAARATRARATRIRAIRRTHESWPSLPDRRRRVDPRVPGRPGSLGRTRLASSRRVDFARGSAGRPSSTRTTGARGHLPRSRPRPFWPVRRRPQLVQTPHPCVRLHRADDLALVTAARTARGETSRGAIGSANRRTSGGECMSKRFMH